jgi:hypothetical protein
MQLFNTKVVPSDTDTLWQTPSLPDMSNKKLLVITKPFAAGSVEAQTLQKMLAACKLSEKDYVVLQIDAQPYSWHSMEGANPPGIVLLLGVMPAQLSIHALFKLHAPNPFAGRMFIPALSLTDIENNPAAKKDLWAAGLKPAFGL